jgi:PQQ-dependent dehydrogenase (methanol/ethanol family)
MVDGVMRAAERQCQSVRVVRRTAIQGFMRRSRVAALWMLCVCAALPPSTKAQPAPPGDHAKDSNWSLLGGNFEQWQHSPLTQVNDRTVTRLGLAWSADIGSGDGLVGNPLIVDGEVYQSGPPGRIYANDVVTGKSLWTFTPEVVIAPKQSWTAFWALHFNRGLALEGDTLFVASNCRVLAVDRKSGHQVWAAQSCDPTKENGITGAPRVGGGKVFIGNSGGDAGRERGYVDAFEAKTGKHLWRFYTMPGDPSQPFENEQMAMAAKTWGIDYWKHSHGSVSPWDAMTYDPASDTLYFGTDGPSPWNPTLRAKDAGDELFSNSIIAVDATTGKYRWHYQTVQHDGWNLAATMHIMLADLPLSQGGRQRVVMTAPKNGFFYVLDAKTGRFISANNYVPVNWASRIDPVSGRPVMIRDANYWEHPGTPVLMLPSSVGGHNWQLMAFEPALGLVYIPATIAPHTMTADSEIAWGVTEDPYYGYRPDAKVKAKGQLIAWDPRTQTRRWSVDRKVPLNGGVLSTAGNLVFQGTADGSFEAFDARDGRRLWKFDTHSTIMAAPSTAMVNGTQYILVPSGNGGSAAMRAIPRLMNTEVTLAPSRLLAFRLDGQSGLPPTAPDEIPQPPRPRQPRAQAEKGGKLFEINGCTACHGELAAGSGPGIPDLRKLTEAKHTLLKQIVVDGLFRPAGMPSYPEMSDADLEAIRAYLINRAWAGYEKH